MIMNLSDNKVTKKTKTKKKRMTMAYSFPTPLFFSGGYMLEQVDGYNSTFLASLQTRTETRIGCILNR